MQPSDVSPDPNGQTPPGWYPDPRGQAVLRWWDGNGWTEHVHTFDRPERGPGIGEWLTSAMRMVSERAGHIFPLGLLLSVIPAGIVAGVLWWALEGVTLTLDPDLESGIEVTGHNTNRLIILGVANLLATLIGTLFAAAARQQSISARAGVAKPWVVSLGQSLSRAGRIVATWIGVMLALLIVWVVIVVAVSIAAVITPILLVLALPSAILVFIFALLKLSLVPSAAALAPRGTSAWKQGLAAASNDTRNLFLRAFILLSVTVFAQFFIGSILSSLSGAGNDQPPVFGEAIEVTRSTLMGQSPVASVGVALATSIVALFFTAFRSTGFAFTYQDRGGAVDPVFLNE